MDNDIKDKYKNTLSTLENLRSDLDENGDTESATIVEKAIDQISDIMYTDPRY